MSASGQDIKVTTFAPTATGTTTITQTTPIDMSGFEWAMLIVRLGSPATNNNIRIKQCDTSGGTYADLVGTLVGNHATDNPLIGSIVRPKEQFLKYEVTRGTTTTIDTILWIQGGPGTRPVTQPSGTQIEHYYDIAEGTA